MSPPLQQFRCTSVASISCNVPGKVVLSNWCDVCPRASCRVNPYRRCIPGDQDVMRPSMVRINLSGEAVSIPRPRPTPFGWLSVSRAVPSASFDMPHVPLPGDEFGKHYRKSWVNGASFGIYSDHARRRVGFSYTAEQPRPARPTSPMVSARHRHLRETLLTWSSSRPIGSSHLKILHNAGQSRT